MARCLRRPFAEYNINSLDSYLFPIAGCLGRDSESRSGANTCILQRKTRTGAEALAIRYTHGVGPNHTAADPNNVQEMTKSGSRFSPAGFTLQPDLFARTGKARGLLDHEPTSFATSRRWQYHLPLSRWHLPLLRQRCSGRAAAAAATAAVGCRPRGQPRRGRLPRLLPRRSELPGLLLPRRSERSRAPTTSSARSGGRSCPRA